VEAAQSAVAPPKQRGQRAPDLVWFGEQCHMVALGEHRLTAWDERLAATLNRDQ
jgi:hypothetical protein